MYPPTIAPGFGVQRMRTIASTSALFVACAISGQTVISVQSGLWHAPSTWDCACVPDFSQSVIVMHSVEIGSPLLMGHQQVQVTAAGEITMTFPASISFNTVLINEGHVLVMGEILNSGLFNNAGFVEFIGTVLNDGSIISDAGSLMQIEGDFVNQDLVQGEGAICVTDLTENSGSISGTLDFCDWTPTVSSPPFIDQNTGAVENGITFCQNSPCATGFPDPFGENLVLSPAIAHDLAVLNGVPVGAYVALFDAAGRLAMPRRRSIADRWELPLSGLPSGSYRLVVHASAGQRVLPLVIAR